MRSSLEVKKLASKIIRLMSKIKQPNCKNLIDKVITVVIIDLKVTVEILTSGTVEELEKQN